MVAVTETAFIAVSMVFRWVSLALAMAWIQILAREVPPTQTLQLAVCSYPLRGIAKMQSLKLAKYRCVCKFYYSMPLIKKFLKFKFVLTYEENIKILKFL